MTRLPAEVFVDVAAFLRRHQLENALSAVDRRANALVRKYFRVAPYLIVARVEARLRERQITLQFVDNFGENLQIVNVDFDEFCANYVASANSTVPSYLRIIDATFFCAKPFDATAQKVLAALRGASIANVHMVFFKLDADAMREMVAHAPPASRLTLEGWPYAQLSSLLALAPVQYADRLTVHCCRRQSYMPAKDTVARPDTIAQRVVDWLHSAPKISPRKWHKSDNFAPSARCRILRVGNRDIFERVERKIVKAFLEDVEPREYLVQFGLLTFIPDGQPAQKQIVNEITGEILYIVQRPGQTFVMRTRYGIEHLIH